ncbi:ribonuclease H-like domain-containing protein [Tanacetum coccineum]
MKVEESLNVTFDESPPPTKSAPLVNDDVGEEQAVENQNNLEDNLVNESLEDDVIVNIKEFENNQLDKVTGRLNERILGSQAQNKNADWAGCPTTRRSTSGYCVFLGNNLLSWSSKRQFTLSQSSAEAEYRGVANAVAETCWLRNLLRELHTPLSTATIVYCDNVSDVYLSSNPVQHQRTKHIENDTHFVRDLVTTGHIRVLHVPSRYQYADIFTKGLPTALFDEFRDSLSVRSSPAQTARGC